MTAELSEPNSMNMKTKQTLAALVALALGTAAFTLTGCNKSEHDASDGHVHQYTCPMHADVVKDAPGDCPKCGMKLVEKK